MNVLVRRHVSGFAGFGAPPTTISVPSPVPDYSGKDIIVPQPVGAIPSAVASIADALTVAQTYFHLAVAAANQFPNDGTTANTMARAAWNNAAAWYFAIFDAIVNQGLADVAVAQTALAQANGLWLTASTSAPTAITSSVKPVTATSRKWPWIVGGVVVAGVVGVVVAVSMHHKAGGRRAAMAGVFGEGGSFGSGFAGGLVGGVVGAAGGLTIAGLIERSILQKLVAAQSQAATNTAVPNPAVSIQPAPVQAASGG